MGEAKWFLNIKETLQEASSINFCLVKTLFNVQDKTSLQKSGEGKYLIPEAALRDQVFLWPWSSARHLDFLLDHVDIANMGHLMEQECWH